MQKKPKTLSTNMKDLPGEINMELGRVNTLAEGVGIPLGAQGGKWLVGRP
jgi:hypothetical protein